jgi:hypothetical protein
VDAKSVSDVADDQSSDQDSIFDGSLQVNLLTKKLPPPTHYKSAAVRSVPPISAIADTSDQWIKSLVQDGADVPKPLSGPGMFQRA